MLEELLPIIVEVLILGKQKATLKEICDFCGYDTYDVSKSLNLLKGLSIVRTEENKNGETEYFLLKELKPIHLARAAQVGLDLASFSDYFHFTEKEKALALELTTKAEQLRNLDITKRKPLLQKRGYLKIDKLDDVGNNLLLFFESSNASLYEYLEKLAEDDAHLKILMTMNEEAESSLKVYIDDLK